MEPPAKFNSNSVMLKMLVACVSGQTLLDSIMVTTYREILSCQSSDSTLFATKLLTLIRTCQYDGVAQQRAPSRRALWPAPCLVACRSSALLPAPRLARTFDEVARAASSLLPVACVTARRVSLSCLAPDSHPLLSAADAWTKLIFIFFLCCHEYLPPCFP